MSGEFLAVVETTGYVCGSVSLLLVLIAGLVLIGRPSAGRPSWPESPLRRELRVGCLWIPCGTVFALALVSRFWLSGHFGPATSEGFLMVVTSGTIWGGIGCLSYWIAGYICGASFRHSWGKEKKKPSLEDSRGVGDRELDGPL